MAIPLTINGATFEYPENFDENWGIQATGWAQAVTNGMLQRAGGNFPLLADVNFGPSFGLLADHFETRVINAAHSGLVRLSKTDAIAWRNNANTADLPLGIDGSDNLNFNGSSLSFTGAVNPASANQLAYYAATGNAVSGLIVITPNKVLVSNASGLPIASGVSNTTLSFLDATSSIQTQLNSISAVASAALPEAGGTMSGNIAMGGNKVTGLAAATTNGDALRYEQLIGLYLLLTGGTMSGAINMGGNKVTNMANGTVATDAAAFGQIPTMHAPTVRRFLSGSGTYTTPTSPSPLYLKIRVIGGGGGGSGSGSSGGGNGTSGTASSFGNALAGGGAEGDYSSSNTNPGFGGAGGTPTIGAGITPIISQAGGAGGVSVASGSLLWATGGAGGTSFFGGAGGTTQNQGGEAANANSGCGGSGGGFAGTTEYGGAGGGAGAYIEAFVYTPSATYSYAVGGGGSGGSAGANGFSGGNGGSGAVYVEEYYQ